MIRLPFKIHRWTLYINITTTDAIRTNGKTMFTFTIDDEVTSTPTFATTGTKTIINNSTYLGPNGRISVATSSMQEASVSIMHNVSGMANTQANTYTTAS